MEDLGPKRDERLAVTLTDAKDLAAAITFLVDQAEWRRLHPIAGRAWLAITGDSNGRPDASV